MNDTKITDSNCCSCIEGKNGVVLFYKKLCPNCRALEKMLEKFSSNNPEITIFRIDSEECPSAMAEYKVERVPTLLIVEDGAIIRKKVGLMNLREMQDFYYSKAHDGIR
jgi:thioredoxin 1